LIPIEFGKVTLNVPPVTSIKLSVSNIEYVLPILVNGKVTPPKLIIPFLTSNSFAMYVFFFHFPKEIFILL